jgi:hypothetical protein
MHQMERLFCPLSLPNFFKIAFVVDDIAGLRFPSRIGATLRQQKTEASR